MLYTFEFRFDGESTILQGENSLKIKRKVMQSIKHLSLPVFEEVALCTRHVQQ